MHSYACKKIFKKTYKLQADHKTNTWNPSEKQTIRITAANIYKINPPSKQKLSLHISPIISITWQQF